MLGNGMICRPWMAWKWLSGAGVLVAGTMASADPAPFTGAERDSGSLSGGASFELVLVTADDELRSMSFALGDGENVEISSGFIDGNESGEDAFVVVNEDGPTNNLTGNVEIPIGSFSRVVVFGD